MTDLQRLLALVPPQVENADPSLCHLTDWVMTVSIAWVNGGSNPNRCCRIAAPEPEEAPACLPGQPLWDEPWDGTLEALRDLRDRAQAGHEWGGAYVIVALERDWEAIEGSWGEEANTIAVFPALVERVDRAEGADINAGYREWLDRLDVAYMEK